MNYYVILLGACILNSYTSIPSQDIQQTAVNNIHTVEEPLVVNTMKAEIEHPEREGLLHAIKAFVTQLIQAFNQFIQQIITTMSAT